MKGRPVVALTIGIVLATTLASGPFVGAVDLTAEQSFAGGSLGDGRATVSDVTFPDRVTFEHGDFGAGSYYLRAGTATATLQKVVGRPIISYEVSIPPLGYTKSTIQVLSSSSEGRIELQLDETAFGKQEIDNESYAATLAVDVRYGGEERPIATENVTIEVIE